MSGQGKTEALFGGVTGRAVLIGLVLVVILIPASLFVELVYDLAYNFGALVPPIAPLALLCLVVAINPILARWGWLGLSRREILTVYVILTVGAPLMSHGILLWWLSCSIGQHYFGRAAPQWEQAFFQYIPAWFYPTDRVAIEGFFQGHASVPWALWSPPLTAWLSFFIALFLANLFLLLILRRQWISSERLTFPIAMVPLETVRERDIGGRRLGHLPVSWIFWLGFAVGGWLRLQASLPAILPWFPSIPTSGETVLIPWQKVGPIAGLGDIWLILYPDIIALAYLIPKELSFSVWFFWIVRVGLTVAAIAAGATPQKPEEWYGTSFPAPYYQGGGAMLALGLWGLWIAGRHLGRVARQAVAGQSPHQREDEPFAYRSLVIGFMVCFAYLVYFCWLAGSRPIVGVALIGLILAYHMVWARLRAETGMSFIAFPFQVNEVMLQPFGSIAYRPTELITISALRWTTFPGWGESSEVITGASLDGLKIADSAKLCQRRLTGAIVAAFLVAILVGAPVLLIACYHYGFLHLHDPVGGWLESMVRQTGSETFQNITTPSKFNPAAALALASGALVTVFLGAMRLRFWWWPFHPVGYIAANVWGSQWWYMPLFIGWALKSLVIRYGGLRLYQRTIPLAVGVIVSSMVVNVLWCVAEWFARASM